MPRRIHPSFAQGRHLEHHTRSDGHRLAGNSTAVGGNPELVQDDVNGRLVPVSNPEQLAREMGRYIRSPELRLRHGIAGRQRAIRDFSVEAMVDSYVRLYDSVCPARS